ncbi:MAG: hypothetical protein COU65_03525 [Candidatus Pacebacteria bacterium CG10_big_fil_rev_8_21_14_0_10_42_12]|nr:MAG: hypothetical protein COU65_03525 [Candidatus Pacebacteria bacterium CG10_big_fil_rev_8_21_14_0_10_42_12]
MLRSNKQQALHKSIIFRVLTAILDDTFLSQNLFFKGGTCASMLGILDRFSVDLDFDLKDRSSALRSAQSLKSIFKKLDLEIKDQSHNTLQYFLKYEAPEQSRNTLKIDAVNTPYLNNKYQKILLTDINRYAICQTKETMFANKLVALIDRYQQNQTIAARDLYDIHHYLISGFDYNPLLITERTEKAPKTYLQDLISFIETKITQKIINQDLNYLIEYKKFNAIRKTLKQETITLLRDRI